MTKELSNKTFKTDFITYALWLIFGFICANYLSPPFLALYFIILSWKMMNIESDVVYIAVYLSLLSNIGGFFAGKLDNIISIGPIQISVYIIFILSMYIKFFINHKKIKSINHFRVPIIIYLAYMLFLLLVGLLNGIEETGQSGLRNHFQIIVLFSLLPAFLIIPKLFNGAYFIERLSSILFISVLINLFGQWFFLLSGISLSEYIKPNIGTIKFFDEFKYLEYLRPVYGVWLSLLSFFFAFYLLFKKQNIFNRYILHIIIFLSFFSIFITATRGWILAFLTFLLLTIIITRKLGIVVRIFSMGILLFMILLSSNLFSFQIEKSLERFMTLEAIVEGDLSAKGTNIRHIRAAEVMEHFDKVP